MQELRFRLTVRREDVLELFADQKPFRLFSKEHSAYLIYTALYVVGLIVSVFNFPAYGNSPFLPVLICSIGTIYNAAQLVKKYLHVKSQKKQIDDWIESFIHFKNHEIVLHDDSFTYYRDRDIFRYDLSKIQYKSFTGTHFELRLTDDSSIVLPAKAFDEDKFAEFVDQVDVIILRLHNRSPHD